jgi:hypothetical protein
MRAVAVTIGNFRPPNKCALQQQAVPCEERSRDHPAAPIGTSTLNLHVQSYITVQSIFYVVYNYYRQKMTGEELLAGCEQALLLVPQTARSARDGALP